MAKNGRSYADINGPSKSPTAARKRGTHSEVSSGPADWKTASPELVLRVVAALSLDGGAVRFGYTRDGGAYAVGIYGDGEPFTEYLSPNEDLNHWLEGIAYDYEK